MKKGIKKGTGCFLVSIGFFAASCAVVKYPGHPGLVTNGFSKIDLEVLMEDGLWVYETTYDNSPGGKGVTAIVTKRYPNARTYTTNVRTNEYGTLYRVKAPYHGSTLQMIAFPQSGQYVLPTDSNVVVTLEYEEPFDEVDDRNIAEEKIFSSDASKEHIYLNEPAKTLNSPKKIPQISEFKWNLLKMGKINPYGQISYDIESVDFDSRTFKPSKKIKVETNLLQNGLHTNIDQATRKEFVDFLEYHYPTGFSGPITLIVNGDRILFNAPITIKTPKMLKNSSHQLIQLPTIK